MRAFDWQEEERLLLLCAYSGLRLFLRAREGLSYTGRVSRLWEIRLELQSVRGMVKKLTKVTGTSRIGSPTSTNVPTWQVDLYGH